MCGVMGLWDVRRGVVLSELGMSVRRMAAALSHRGPDDEGYFVDDSAGIGLGFRRLSIVDLSQEGHQPMTSASGRYVIVFNGEVYNHARLRPELERAGFTFRGHSDTEVMLAAVEQWGLKAALARFIGMFAFALWDKRERELILVRDRLGIKPLYYGWVGSLFVFGSELKAFTVLPGFRNPVDRNALCMLLRHNYIPAPYSIYRNIYKLSPGSLLRVDADLARQPANFEEMDHHLETYWSAREIADTGVKNRLGLSDSDAIGALDTVLRDAVALRMEADVPLGAFLSGGVDSSTVVALMQAQSPRPVKTFSIGFHEDAFNEAQFAKAVARHLGTEHEELYVTSQDALDVVPRLPTMYDEPFADFSQIPTFLVSRMARSSVTVALSGDGGDELFLGYTRHLLLQKVWRYLRPVPLPLRRAMAAAIHGVPPGAWDSMFTFARPFTPSRFRVTLPGHKVHRLADVLGDASPRETYLQLISQWSEPAAVVVGARTQVELVDMAPALSNPALRAVLNDPIEQMLYDDLVTYLPDDILAKVDRASMAVSLEARVPFLDHRVVEFAWRTPMQQKMRDGQGKWLLRQVLYKYVPKELIERPKMGFGIPLEHWLRGPLRDWAEALLHENKLRDAGYFDPAPLRRAWREHLSGRRNRHYQLWSVLMFQAWLEAQHDSQGSRLQNSTAPAFA